MDGFIGGVVSSLVATALGVMALRIWILARPLNRRFVLKLLRIGIDGYYGDRRTMERDLLNHNRTTRKLWIITNRGLPLGDPAVEGVPIFKWAELEQARMLLLNPESESARRRAAEIKALTRIAKWDYDHFKADIRNSALKMEGLDKVALRLHSEPSVFRLILTDDYAYISGFPRRQFGVDIPVIRAPVGSFLYDLFEKYFDEVWLRSEVPAKLGTG